MKRLLIILLAALSCVALSAQITQDGYYRVMNYGVYKATGKKAYCCITYKECKVNMSAGTSQKFEPIALWSNDETPFSDPAAVIYITNPSSVNNCNLESQGVSIRRMFDGSLKLSGSQNSYTLYATSSGQSAYLGSTDKSNFSGANAHYILTTASSETHRFWSIYPVDSNNDKYYFGVKPTLTAQNADGDTKYYAPYYVSFPFKPKSPGMKVYYVSQCDNKSFELEEITGVVPAATPVIIECSSPNSSDNRLDILPPATPVQAVGGNMLSGVYFFNKFISTSTYPDALTRFDAATMRVWNVEDGRLVLSTATDKLSKYDMTSIAAKQYYCLNANQSYLTVSSSASATLVSRVGIKATITFDSNGGSAVSPLSGKAGATVTAPATPVREGYTFAGWEPELPATFPEEDLTLTARWQANPYKATFVSDGITLKEETVLYGAAITHPATPAKEGYTFLGWDNADIKTMPARDVTFTARWQVNQYNVAFVSDGATIKFGLMDYGAAITHPAAPVKEGYTFLGWDNAGVTTVPARDITFTAQWRINQWTVKFVSDDTVLKEAKLDYGKVITPPAAVPSKPGADFIGWSPAFADGTTMPDHDVTYNAVFSTNTYTITFNSAGGTSVPSIKGVYGSAVASPAAPVREGYTFLGWLPALPTAMPAEDMTLTAQWQVNQYKVTFLSDGATIKSGLMDYGTAIALPANPVKEGYTFLGWDNASVTTVPARDITFTAQWQVNQYTVTFLSWGETLAQETLPYGAAISLPAIPETSPSHAYYDFLGWDNAGVTAVPARDLTFTAQWSKKKEAKTIELSEGAWNWVSFASASDAGLAKLLASAQWQEGDEVKDARDHAAYSATYGRWFGSLASRKSLNPTGMYKLYSAIGQTLTLPERELPIPSETPITVTHGWNYIAFLPVMGINLGEALAAYQPSDGDVIKSRDAFAIYSAQTKEWKGDLTSLEAGQGYMMKRTSAKACTFAFPDYANAPLVPPERGDAAAHTPPLGGDGGGVRERAGCYSGNMNLVASISGISAQAGDHVVAAASGETRGAAIVADDGRIYLTIQGDSREPVALSLVRDGEVIALAKAPVAFEGDAVIGSYDQPTAIPFVKATGSAATALPGTVTAIYAAGGSLLATKNLSSLPRGVYLVHSESNGTTTVTKIIKK